jgi:hypothetical protein
MLAPRFATFPKHPEAAIAENFNTFIEDCPYSLGDGGWWVFLTCGTAWRSMTALSARSNGASRSLPIMGAAPSSRPLRRQRAPERFGAAYLSLDRRPSAGPDARFGWPYNVSATPRSSNPSTRHRPPSASLSPCSTRAARREQEVHSRPVGVSSHGPRRDEQHLPCPG